MMLLRGMVAVLLCCGPLTVFAASAKPICGPLPPESQKMEVAWITESDLTAEAVRKAISDLEAARYDPSWGGGHHDHIVVGDLLILEGYVMKYEAEHYKSPKSVKKFCKWLTKAYWPE